MQFKSFDLESNILSAIDEMGYVDATAIQHQAIPVIQANCDLMARAQTGTGKTAAFALPILQKISTRAIKVKGISTLILVPTRELANQVFNSFCNYGKYCKVRSLMVYGGVSIKPQIAELSKDVDIVVATPGRLLDLINNNHIALNNIHTLVFDEADRLLDLGFKQEINSIIKNLPENIQTLLFSATFDASITKFSKSILKDPTIIKIDDVNSVAKDIEEKVYTVDADKKRELTSFMIGSKNWQQVLIFVRTKKQADWLAKEMCKDGIKTSSLHGDKSQGSREAALSDFKQGKCRALVATDVAARGLDIVDLEYVINYELPYEAEDYIHRVGRTARAGKSGYAVTLLSPDEEWLLTAIEELLDCRLLQQWYPGYEPDLNAVIKPKKPGDKQRARNKSLGKENSKRKHKRRSTRTR
jgi:superfamily II DNA/RNA helicase